MRVDGVNETEPWVILLLRGGLLIVLGAAAFLFPFATLFSLAMLVAIVALAEGLVLIALAIESGRSGRRSRFADLAWGVAALLAGAFVLLAPLMATAGLSMAALLLLALWFVVSGFRALIGARRGGNPRLGRGIASMWGLFMIVVGLAIPVLLVMVPASFAALAWVVATSALFVGLTLVWQALTLRGAASRTAPETASGEARTGRS